MNILDMKAQVIIGIVLLDTQMYAIRKSCVNKPMSPSNYQKLKQVIQKAVHFFCQTSLVSDPVYRNIQKVLKKFRSLVDY